MSGFAFWRSQDYAEDERYDEEEEQRYEPVSRQEEIEMCIRDRLGILFLMATVLIIYYKQIIEGYDDRARFEILQKVGMDKKLIAASVRSQIPVSYTHLL